MVEVALVFSLLQTTTGTGLPGCEALDVDAHERICATSTFFFRDCSM
jgi:hypothetical protein